MRARTLVFLATIAAFGAGSASADEMIVHEHAAPGVSVQVPGAGVRVGVPTEHRDERRVIENNGRSDCHTKTVTREDETGSTSVHKERCD